MAGPYVGHDLLDLLECPVCMEPMYPPIYQCSNGHTICSNCKPSVRNSCPTCRNEMGDIRSLALEKLAASLHLPCRYHSTGCTGMYRYDSKQRHEQECKFRPFNCPYPCNPCVITGDALNLVNHLQHDHNSAFYQNCEIDEVFRHIHPYNDEDASLNIAVYGCLGENFFLHFEAFHFPSDMVYMTFLTFMGSEVEAMNFRYSLEVGNEDGKVVWEGIPRSIREGVDHIRESYDGLIIHLKAALCFAEADSMEERTLRVKGHIWKEDS